jgi:hypothetical protein
MNKRLLKNLIVVLVLSCLFACSSTRLAYNYLDWMITWYLDDYIELNSEQDDYYDRQLDKLLQWHRSDQLPRYARFVDEMMLHINKPVHTDMLLEQKEMMREFMRVFMARAAPDCIKLLLWLDSDQRQDFYAAGAEKQKKLEEKYLDETEIERSKRRCKRMKKLLKRFIGRLTDEQERIVKRWADSLTSVNSLWLGNRRNVMNILETVLEGSDTDTGKKRRLYQLLVEPESLWSTAYRWSVRQNEIQTLDMFAAIHNSMIEKQRKHLHDSLSRLKKDFERLAEGKIKEDE